MRLDQAKLAECRAMAPEFDISKRPVSNDSTTILVGGWFIWQDLPWEITVNVTEKSEDEIQVIAEQILDKSLEKLKYLAKLEVS